MRAQRADLARLHQHGRADVRDDGSQVAPPPGEEGVEEARGPAARPARPRVLEEDVHELPQHVVERLDQLLAHERVIRRGLEDPSAAPGAKAIVRQPLAGAEPAPRLAEDDHRVARLGEQLELPGGERERRQRSLADDHRMDELDRDVARVGLVLRRCAARASRRPPREEAVGEHAAELRDPRGLRA